jgi:hypothetical protein
MGPAPPRGPRDAQRKHKEEKPVATSSELDRKSPTVRHLLIAAEEVESRNEVLQAGKPVSVTLLLSSRSSSVTGEPETS